MQVGAFALVRLLCLAISTVALTLGLLVMPKLAAKLVSIVITFFFAYNLSSRLVYR
jgi:hypothetical protein